MAKINANGNISYLLLPLVFMVLSRTVGAVEITFYSNTQGCVGNGASTEADLNKCYAGQGASVGFTGMKDTDKGVVYDNPACFGSVGHVLQGNGCLPGVNAKSALWYGQKDKTACMSKGSPTSVVYTEASNEGTWVLKCSNALEMFSTLESLPEAGKVNWLRDNGAVFVPTSIVSIV